MRTLRILLLSFAAFFCFGALSAQAKPPVRVFNKESHFSLEVPDGWKRRMDPSKPIWMYLAPVEKTFTPNVNVVISHESVPALRDEKTFSGMIRKQYTGIATVFDVKAAAIAGLPAYSCHSRMIGGKFSMLEYHQLFCVYNSRMYVVTFTYLIALKKKYDSIGDQILASFRFEK